MAPYLPPASEQSRPQPPEKGPLRYLGGVLAVYWIGLFTATHIPLPSIPLEAEGADKVVHLAGYAGLGFLLGQWSALRQTPTWRRLLWLYAILVTYGALDEWLQQFVNRNTDPADWIADCAGAAAGLLLARAITRVPKNSQPLSIR